MKRVLLFCARDWLHPRAGRIEHYAHEVFSRLAAQGHSVTWVSAGGGRVRGKRPQHLETADGIQIARLGARFLYRMMAGMFMAKVQRRESGIGRFDAVIDCITSAPLPLAPYTDAPIIPLVFSLSRKVQAAEQPPGPVIAATDRARRDLLEAGFPRRYIVYAPYGTDTRGECPKISEADTPLVIATDTGARGRAPSRLLKTAVAALHKNGTMLRIESPKNAGPSGAWAGCCAEGAEEHALDMGAAGLPVVCPATEPGKEYVEHGSTGLLFAPGNARELAGCLRQLVDDVELRHRLGRLGRERAEAQSWDRTASLVLATIENLRHAPEEPAPQSQPVPARH